jgi:hypothetical protein
MLTVQFGRPSLHPRANPLPGSAGVEAKRLTQSSPARSATGCYDLSGTALYRELQFLGRAESYLLARFAAPCPGNAAPGMDGDSHEAWGRAPIGVQQNGLTT